MQITGKVHQIGETQQVSDTFKKRELIVEYAENPTYPEYIRFESNQDKTTLLDKLKVGDNVEVSFNLRGRAWTNKEGVTTYFNSLVVWRIDAQKQGITPEYAPQVDISKDADSENLPF